MDMVSPARKLQRNNSLLVGAKLKLENKVKRLEAELQQLQRTNSNTALAAGHSQEDVDLQAQLDKSLREQGRLREDLESLRHTERDLLARLRVAEKRAEDGSSNNNNAVSLNPAKPVGDSDTSARVAHLEKLLKRKDDELQELDTRLNQAMHDMRESQQAKRAVEDALEEARDDSADLRAQLAGAGTGSTKHATDKAHPSTDAHTESEAHSEQLRVLHAAVAKAEAGEAESRRAFQQAERRALKAESELEQERSERVSLQAACDELQAAVDTLEPRNARVEDDEAMAEALTDLARRVAEYEEEQVSLQSLRATLADEMQNLRAIQLDPQAFIEKHLSLQRRTVRAKRGEVRELEQELNREVQAKLAAEAELNHLRAARDAHLTELRQSFEQVCLSQ